MATKKGDYFYDVIGQADVKDTLTYRLDNHRNNGAVTRHTLFTGHKGDGKSYLARKFGRALPDPSDPSKGNKDFFTFNGGAIKSPKMLFEDILAQLGSGYWTVFIDEAHALPDKVEDVLLTLLEPGPANRNTYDWDDTPFEIDFHKHTFLFATTDQDRMAEPLRDRLDKIVLDTYTDEELGEIIKLHVDGAAQIAPSLLKEIGAYIRKNARAAFFMADDIRATGKSRFTKKDWAELKAKINYLPLGLYPDELKVLRLLEKKDLSLNMLASRVGRPTRAIQHDVETYIKALGFMEIDGKRRITQKGRDYLKNLP